MKQHTEGALTFWMKRYAALALSLFKLLVRFCQDKLHCKKNKNKIIISIHTSANNRKLLRGVTELLRLCFIFFVVVSFLPAPDPCVVIPVSSVSRFGLQFLNLSLPLESKLLLNWIPPHIPLPPPPPHSTPFPFLTRKEKKGKEKRRHTGLQ